ncbi:UNVERIFIED_ORG: hypothetical protein EDC92_1179 [Dietzia maris]
MNRARPMSRATLTELAHRVSVEVPVMSASQLFRRAIAHYNRRNPGGRLATLDSDPDFICRLSVNFLRHQHSSYDSTRDFLRGIATEDDRAFVGAIIKGRVLRQIALTYPMLRSEALRQARREDTVVNGAPRRNSTPSHTVRPRR